MGKPKDLTKMKFGTLTPIEIVGKGKSGHMIWKCKCDCGRERIVNSSYLKQENVKSCGDCQRSTIPKEIKGQWFGDLMVMYKAKGWGTKTAWWCFCERCGNIKAIKTNRLIQGKAEGCGCRMNYIVSELQPGKVFGKLTILGKSEVVGSSWWYNVKCICGTTTVINGDYLRNGTTKSCGCLQKELARIRMAKLKGPLNYNWKGGSLPRKTLEYKIWRKLVLQKYNYYCYICGTKERLEAHHLDAFLKYEDKRYDPNNGVCLCNSCHKIFHAIYGSGDNNSAQFDEFLLSLNLPTLHQNSV